MWYSFFVNDIWFVWQQQLENSYHKFNLGMNDIMFSWTHPPPPVTFYHVFMGPTHPQAWRPYAITPYCTQILNGINCLTNRSIRHRGDQINNKNIQNSDNGETTHAMGDRGFNNVFSRVETQNTGLQKRDACRIWHNRTTWAKIKPRVRTSWWQHCETPSCFLTRNAWMTNNT